MRYIKLFEESKMSRTDELKQFCNDNLAYLTDDGFSAECEDYKELYIYISIRKDNGNYSNALNFNWFDVRDDIIPFIITLNDKYSNKYNINVTFKTNRHNIDINIQDIIEDRLKDIKFLDELQITLE